MKKTTRKTGTAKRSAAPSDELRPEYEFDYRNAKPNRFAQRMEKNRLVLLDADVAKVFTSPEAVNNLLRALITALPTQPGQKS